jgi:hypothetical protein
MKTLVLLLLISSCTQKLLRVPMLKKTDSGTVSTPVTKPSGVWMESQESCTEKIFMIPTKSPIDINKLYKKTCLVSDYLHNVEVRRWWINVPYIYSNECVKVKADCGDQYKK